jgi:hypothetical protein
MVALGCPELGLENVTCIAVGELSDQAIARCYQGASCVIFPTHYEGFGFPILHALARSKPVFVREIPAFQEIGEHLAHGSENIHWFRTTSELTGLLKLGLPTWIGQPARGDHGGWTRSALEVHVHVERRIATVSAGFVSERLRNLEAAFSSPPTQPVPAELTAVGAAARRGGEYCERLLNRILANPALYQAARGVWRFRRFSLRRGRRA